MAPRPVEFLVRWREVKRGNRFRPHALILNPVRRVGSRLAFPTTTAGFETLKVKLLQQALRTFDEAHFERPLRAAAEKAGQLALLTGHPMLLFPELFRELAIPLMAKSELQRVVE